MRDRNVAELRKQALDRILDLFPEDRGVYENGRSIFKSIPPVTRMLLTTWMTSSHTGTYRAMIMRPDTHMVCA